MDDERFTTPRETSRHESRPSTSQRLAYATQRAEVLFGCYRRGDANDPDRYVTSIAAVLTLYDENLIRDVTDPRTGISTSEKFRSFMPNSGELRAYCDTEAARRARLAHLASLPKVVPANRRLEAPEPPQGSWANVFVPEGHPRYASMCEWTKTEHPKFWKFGQSSDGRPGLWISLSAWDGGAKQTLGHSFNIDSIKPRDLTLSDAARQAMSDRYEPTDANRTGDRE